MYKWFMIGQLNNLVGQCPMSDRLFCGLLLLNKFNLVDGRGPIVSHNDVTLLSGCF